MNEVEAVILLNPRKHSLLKKAMFCRLIGSVCKGFLAILIKTNSCIANRNLSRFKMSKKSVRRFSKAVLILMLLPLLLSMGCSSSSDGGNSDSDIYAGKLVSSTLIKSFTAQEANTVLEQYYAPMGYDVTDLLNSSTDANAYDIEYYTTNIDGQLIVVSGLVAIPSPANETYSVVQYHHGTQFNNADVPSNPGRSDEATVNIALFGAHGYVASLPDYIGQGKSKVKHPYLVNQSEAVCNADMLKAVKELCSKLSVSVTGKVFITGLSEGGHTTLAVQEYLETSSSEEAFTLTASAPIGGPYDPQTLWDLYITASPKGSAPITAHWILAYKYVYQFDDTLDDIFLPPYNTTIEEIDDGNHNGHEMYEMLPKAVAELLRGEFIAAVDAQIHPFYDEMILNIPYNFAPTTPTRLYHAKSDEIAPYSGAEIAYNKMISLGADDVELIDLGSNLTHEQSIFPGTLLAMRWFDTLK